MSAARTPAPKLTEAELDEHIRDMRELHDLHLSAQRAGRLLDMAIGLVLGLAIALAVVAVTSP